MRTEKNINNSLGLKGEAVEAFEQSYASYSEALIGIDLSQGNDFTAFAPLFPLDDCFGMKVRSYISDTICK